MPLSDDALFGFEPFALYHFRSLTQPFCGFSYSFCQRGFTTYPVAFCTLFLMGCFDCLLQGVEFSQLLFPLLNLLFSQGACALYDLFRFFPGFSFLTGQLIDLDANL